MRAYLYGAGLLVHQNKIPAAVIVLERRRIGRASIDDRTSRPAALPAPRALLADSARTSSIRSGRPAAVPALPDSSRAPHGSQSRHHSANRMTVGRRWRGAVQAFFVLGLALFSAVWLRNTASAIASGRSDTADRLAIVEAAARLRSSGAVLVLGSWASSPAMALATGEFWVGNAWSMVGEKVYPGQLFLSGDGYLRTWKEGLGSGWDFPQRQSVSVSLCRGAGVAALPGAAQGSPCNRAGRVGRHHSVLAAQSANCAARSSPLPT